MVTLRAYCQQAERRLRDAGIEETDLEVRELVSCALSLDRRTWDSHAADMLSEEQTKRMEAFLDRRLHDEPLAYILGEWDFYGYTFAVTPDVLIPRGDTEWLCDAAVQACKKYQKPRVLDLCCGSGCVGIALALSVPDAQVVGMDCSDAALAVTRHNAARNGITAPRYQAQKGDALAPDSIAGEFDIVVTNPPYITAQEMRELDRSVAEFEPALALFGGEDGLDFYRVMAQHPPFRMAADGRLFAECGWKQGEQVRQLFESAGWTNTEVKTDLAGVPRIVCAGAPRDNTNSMQEER